MIIPARDAAGTIGRTLACLERQEAPFEFETIVVDDDSHDDTPAIVRASGLAPTLLRQERIGAAEARNQGVGSSKGEVLAFLDADCFPTPDWLAAGVRALDEADIVQGHVRPDPGVEAGPFDRTLWVTEHNGLWQTANVFVTRELFERVGGFEDWLDVDVGKLIAEDVWFGWRATRAGGRAAFAEDALVHHAVFPRGPRGYIAERRRVRYFPPIVARMPELRQTMLYRGLFLSVRTAAFDAGLTALAIAALTRSRLPLAGWMPYALMIRRDQLRGRRSADKALVLVADVVADALAAAELVRSSLRWRSPVL